MRALFEADQRRICLKYGSQYLPSPEALKLGLSLDFSLDNYPLNALRHHPENGTCGWYLWSGETFSAAEDFFQPIHVSHIAELYPGLMKFLGLAPDWRFLIAPDFEDVWWDSALLTI